MEEPQNASRVLFFNPYYFYRDEPPAQTGHGTYRATSGMDFQGLYLNQDEQHRFVQRLFGTKTYGPAILKTVWTGFLRPFFLPTRRWRDYDSILILGEFPIIALQMRYFMNRKMARKFMYYTFSTEPSSRGPIRKLSAWARGRSGASVYISQQQLDEHDVATPCYKHDVGADERFWKHDAPALSDIRPEIEDACRDAILIVGDAGRNDDVARELASKGHKIVRITRRRDIAEEYAASPCSGLTCLNAISFPELRRAYQVGRCVLLPLKANREPWGMNSLLEALLMGVPVITDHDYTFNCLTEEERQYVRYSSPSELSDGLPALLAEFANFPSAECAEWACRNRSLLKDELQLKSIADRLAAQ